MAFLYGVLNAVKDDDAVRTYDKDISGDKIDTVISMLQSSIGSGRNGLVDAVDAVKGWLEGYEGKILTMTGAVGSALYELTNDISGKHISGINDSQGLEEQLKEWKTTLTSISHNARKIETDHVNFLDYTLCNKLNSEIKVVKEAVKMLEESANDEVLAEKVKEVDDELAHQKIKVEKEIHTICENVKDTLHKEFYDMRETVKSLEKIRGDEFEKMSGHLNDVKAFFLMLNDNYKTDINTRFEEIKALLDDVNKDKNRGRGESVLLERTDDVKVKVEKIGHLLKTYVMSLDTWMKTANNDIYESQKEAFQLRNNEVGSDHRAALTSMAEGLVGWKSTLEQYIDEDVRKTLTQLVEQAQEQLRLLDVRLRNALYQAKTKIKGAFAHYKSGLNGIATLDGNVKDGLSNVRTQILSNLNSYVTSELGNRISKKLEEESNKIAHKSDSALHPGKLDEIINEVKKYVKDVGDNIGKTDGTGMVGEWINKLFKEEGELVTGQINTYFSRNRHFFNSGSGYNSAHTLHEPIKTAILTNLHSDIYVATKMQLSGTHDDFSADTNKIKSFFVSYADGIDAQLQPSMNDSFTSKIVKQIEAGLALTDRTTSGHNRTPLYQFQTPLKNAVKSILQHISQVVRQFALELDAFTSKYKMNSNIMDAIRLVRALGSTVAEKCKNVSAGDGLGITIQGDLEEQVNKHIHNVKESINIANIMTQFHSAHTLLKSNLSKADFDEIVNAQLPDGAGKGPGVNIDGIGNYKDSKSALTQTLSSLATKSADLDVNATKLALDEFSSDMKLHLTKLSEAITEAGGVINGQLHKLRTDNIEKKLRAIRIHIENVQADNVEGVSNAIYTVLEKIRTLENVPSDVETRRVEVEKIFKQIETEVNNRFVFLNEMAKKSSDAVADAISAVQDMLRKSRETLLTGLQNLKKNILTVVIKSFDDITDEVRKLFSRRKRADLLGLKSLVDRQLDTVKGIIGENINTGVKGFLQKLHEQFVTKVYTINDVNPSKFTPKSPLSSGAGILSTAFTAFFATLRKQQDFTFDFDKISSTNDALSQLLKDLATSQHFDHGFTKNLQRLQNRLRQFTPEKFGDGESPSVLEALRRGYPALVGELEKAYVRVYDGGQKIQWDDRTEQQYGAKIFCTISPMLLDTLSELRRRCKTGGQWRDHPINLHEVDRPNSQTYKITNPLGAFLADCGYVVSTDKQDGQLRHNDGCKGNNIYEFLTNGTHYLVKEHDEIDDEASRKIHGVVRTICNYLKLYYEACHLPTSTKHPSSAYQMLYWLTGLPHSPVYNALSHEGFSGLFEKKDEEETATGDGSIVLKFEDDDKLPAYPNDITANNMRGVLTEVCHYAEQTLISILGHGHSGGIYACEFNTNSIKLTYPSDPSKCVDLLIEISNRLYHQLCFLHNQCTYESDLSGWADCWYGRDIGGSEWRCNSLQCPKQTADQKHNQTCDQKCNQSAGCGLKSPLQSFLEDGLPGFLPHPYNKADCKMGCSLSNHSGIPCKTPMGFGDISTMASHTQRGARIYSVLDDFCGSDDSPLTMLCAYFACLLATPPKTLGDMFAFYYNFLNDWSGTNPERTRLRELPYADAVKNANFKNDDNRLDITSMFKSASHEYVPASTHMKGDLFTLVGCNPKHVPTLPCGPYLQPLSLSIPSMFSETNADKYLSWIVYLTETFYDLLSKLLADCKSKCGLPQSRCNQYRCIKNCPAATSSTKTPSPTHSAGCKSIVQCKSALPNLYKYGFHFGSATVLNGTYKDEEKRTCNDFCQTLERILNNKKTDGHALADLVFDKIPEFLWKVRQRFFWTTVALWLLSFLYLLHIMVIRLDLLHIKSHLHSPSSHRIAAQSLLAAGRVGKLNRVFYLQP
ncbi:hypothetical protein, conserved [Babesia bigemina]|uniref:C3H1-type domain-containing protein n=1 Tax=Babesia bigemina TaxID=5866 RepID=A0A061BR18_BABBI|nr:hypothetical protein, conserved [Babesia bigemina]CDR71898.1 hypothetical protein, conserved [Babesia bigemina]|eukprot:XP_012770840.1 hypothetical protein, conserved [Babesia bigemina]